MPSQADAQAAADSIRTFFRREFEEEISDLKARLLYDYFLRELGPFAYNRGVRDAETYFRAKVEDLTATCFEEPLAYWRKKKP